MRGILVGGWLLLSAAVAVDSFVPLSARPSPTRSSVANAVSTRTKFLGTVVGAAATPQEDLELTRQLVLKHIAKMQGGHEGIVDDDNDSEIEKTAVDTKAPAAIVVTSGAVDRPKNDLMIRAALGDETVEKTPLWLFRQAGRHLPEYMSYKKEKNMSFLDLLKSPETVAECTMQPIRRYDLDAAILFSDILVVPEALGIPVTMPGGVGIQVPEPLQSPDDAASRLPAVTDAAAFVQDNLSHVIGAVTRIRQQMAAEGKSIPLIGFSAAPWTLLFYMVGGSSKKNTDAGVQWLKEYPDESRKLLDMLSSIVTEYLAAQVEAGAHMLQIFEAMGMMIDDDNFVNFAMPCLEKIGKELKSRYPKVPLMVFCRGACQMNAKVAALGCFDVITIDGSVSRATARQSVGRNDVTVQGNYDPAELIADNGKTVESVRETARQMLLELGPTRYIANLGEGLGGKESTELVEAFVTAIHEESAAIIAGGKSS
jgi:uroporphyrinogen decarboxylase